MIKKMQLLVLFAVLGVGASAERVYLSGKGPSDAVAWDFLCSEGRRSGEWTTIPVPSNWEQQGFGGYDYGHVAPRKKHGETGQYKTRFVAPDEWQNKTVRLVFEGVMTDTSVKLNGKSIGSPHQGGYDRFHYVLTDTGKYGQHAIEFGKENVLEVMVSKKSANASLEAAERKADYWVFGGIYRPVYLEILPKAFIDRVAIDAKADGQFRMDVFPQVYLERHPKGGDHVDQMTARIETLDGTPVGGQMTAVLMGNGAARVQLQTHIETPNTWSPEHPNLYQVRVSLLRKGSVIHEVVERFGFRTIEVRMQDGLYLNGKKIRIRGVNRNTFRPDTARAIDPEEAWEDARAIKAMNANAVRCHLPATKAFMQACDELGLLFMVERPNWQRPVADPSVSRSIVYNLVTDLHNHPSLMGWANGNESGFNPDVDQFFALLDLQQRPVLHPWAPFDGIDTRHYIEYDELRRRLEENANILLPTEFLHGLYDGGHGAGLDDFWSLMRKSPLSAGGFLWCWADAAIERTDQNGRLDTDGNHSADGIVGPYGEKEGSYYTIREIWSPVQVPLAKLPADFSGVLPIENRFDETDLNACRFGWRLLRVEGMKALKTVGQGTLNGPAVPPGSRGEIRIPAPLDSGDVLELVAVAPSGREIMHWSWPLRKTLRAEASAVRPVPVGGNLFHIKAGKSEWRFSEANGQLIHCSVGGRPVGLQNGPVRYAAAGRKIFDFADDWSASAEQVNDSIVISSRNQKDGSHYRWTVKPGGFVELDYSFAPIAEPAACYAVGFDLPEDSVASKRWLGDGPFRVWGNRMKGPRFGLWENDFNDGIAGERWQLPEFKGVFSNVEWMQLHLKNGAGLLVESDYRAIGVLRPSNGKAPRTATWNYPEAGGLFVFHTVPAVGTKFKRGNELGPQGQPEKHTDPLTGSLRLRVQ